MKGFSIPARAHDDIFVFSQMRLTPTDSEAKGRKQGKNRREWMVKCNSKAILEIDVYAITLRNRQIYFYSSIIIIPSTPQSLRLQFFYDTSRERASRR